MNLRDLSSVEKIDNLLQARPVTAATLDRQISNNADVPGRSNRVKLTVEFDVDLGRYVMSQRDK